MSESLHAHVDRRLETHYPAKTYAMPEGALIPEVVQMVSEQAELKATKTHETAFDMKQATMSDASTEPQVFQSVRPVIVLAEATTHGVLEPNLLVEHALGELVFMDVTMTNVYLRISS